MATPRKNTVVTTPRKKTWEGLLQQENKYNDYEFPMVSVIIPTYNSTAQISLTLDTILGQKYPNFQVIIVDGGSLDHTVEMIKNYRDERISIYSVAGFQRYEMLNKGILQSHGEYLNFLFAGDFYINPNVLFRMMEIALDEKKPDLVYCGTLLRDGRSDPKILFRLLSLALLKKGQQPTSLQSCWFRKDTLRTLGKFNTGYEMRGGFELMCRFCLNPQLRQASTNQVLTDYDLRLVKRSMVFKHFTESLRIIYHYFGFAATMKWIFIQKDFSRILRLWLRGIKSAFTGR